MVSKSVSERVAGRKVNGFCLEMTPSGRFWGSKSKNFKFFFGSQMGFWVVWGCLGIILGIFGRSKFPCRWPTQPGRPVERLERDLIGRGWTVADGCP